MALILLTVPHTGAMWLVNALHERGIMFQQFHPDQADELADYGPGDRCLTTRRDKEAQLASCERRGEPWNGQPQWDAYPKALSRFDDVYVVDLANPDPESLAQWLGVDSITLGDPVNRSAD